jgi:hypothetical protein
LAIPVLLILAVLWAAVLVPPVLRSRSESRRGDVGDFTSRLGSVTGRRSARSMGRRTGRPLHAVPGAGFGSARPDGVEGRRGNGARAAHSASQPIASVAPPAPTSSAAQRRRRDVLIILSGSAIVSLVVVLLLGSPILWLAQVLADLMLVIYVVLLLLMKRRGSLAELQMDLDSWPHGVPAIRPLAHPRVPSRPELALSGQDSSLRRTAAR